MATWRASAAPLVVGGCRPLPRRGKVREVRLGKQASSRIQPDETAGKRLVKVGSAGDFTGVRMCVEFVTQDRLFLPPNLREEGVHSICF